MQRSQYLTAPEATQEHHRSGLLLRRYETLIYPFKMPSIAIDASFIRPGAVGGAQQMLENLLEALCLAATPDDMLVVAGYPSRTLRRARERVSWLAPPTGRNRFVQSWRFAAGNDSQYDALLFPNYFTPPLGRRKSRVVTVIHDLQYRSFPATFSRVKRLWLRASHLHTLRRADVVVTISKHVRDEIVSLYGNWCAKKVIAIPNPISWQRFEGTDDGGASPLVPSSRYVLAVSAQYVHKNLATLIDAFAILRRRRAYSDVVLVLVGQWSNKLVGIAHAVDLVSQVARLGLQDAVRFTGFIEDNAVGVLYQKASMFVFPSLFEGFGMPAVEALGFGLPVLTTRRTAIPETTLGLATYLDKPLDAAEMADAIAAILDNPQRFRPAASDVTRVRETYALERIGRLYRDALVG
jgi:glycosyltransferase involved in cell wall biosynthesis